MVAGPLSLLAVMSFAAKPTSHVVTTPSAVVRAPLGEETSCDSPYAAPFGAGEKLDYSVKFGFIKAGQGSVEVVGRDTIRGREVWHTRFRVKGGVPMYKVDDVLESWIDTGCFQSLRFVQQLEERGKTRERRIEMYPERLAFSENDKPEERSAPRPLDDGSFFFFVRTQDLVVGETYEFGQYFRPDRNPVVIRVLGRERVKVPAGEFDTIVLQPVIKTKGIFSEKGEARIWLTDDSSRVMVKMQAKVSFGTLTMSLTSVRRGVPEQVIANAADRSDRRDAVDSATARPNAD
jgi:hypothetical protein